MRKDKKLYLILRKFLKLFKDHEIKKNFGVITAFVLRKRRKRAIRKF